MMLFLTIIFSVFVIANADFEVPEAKVEVFTPRGLRVSIPDEEGIKLFAFHAKVNEELNGREGGTYSRDIIKSKDGRWTFYDPYAKLNVGDVIYYWTFVDYFDGRNKLGYVRDDQEFVVNELLPKETPVRNPVTTTTTAKSVQNCQPSITKINGGNTPCANQLLFEDTFTNPYLDENKWLKEQYVAWSPDFEFVSYERRPENCFIKENSLYFKTTIRENPFVKQVDLTEGCTRKQCVATGASTIPPPIVSAKVKSKFSFLYGKIEIRAKLPIGDWIYPQLYLEPKDNIYGEGYESGRILVAYARGNRDLVHTSSGSQIGNTVLYSGPVLTKDEPIRSQFLTTVRNNDPWGLNFYTFTLTWTPDGITFAVNGETKGTTNPPFNQVNLPYTSLWPTKIAPFDKEFVITLGLGVGGSTDFPDATTSNGINKPWRKTQAKSTLLFYQANHTWYPTWNENDSALKVESVRVWSL